MDATVPPRDMWLLLISALRYAMGRATYIVDDTCEMILRYRGSLTKEQLAQIRREVATELERATDRGQHLGHACDHACWQRLVTNLDRLLESPT